jgi:hypothetical protein
MLTINKLKKSTIVLFFLSLPAVFVFVNTWTTNWNPVTITLNTNQQQYSQRFHSFSSSTRYCLALSIERPSFKTAEESSDFYDNLERIYKEFDFNWVLSKKGGIISDGYRNTVQSRNFYAYDTIGFEFSCFTTEPFKQNNLVFNLFNIPDKIKALDLQSKVLITLLDDERINMGYLYLFSIIWLIILLPFILVKVIGFIKNR